MISDRDYLNLFNSEYDLLEKELSQIVEEELLKNEEDMDPDLIEYCLNLINKNQVKKVVIPMISIIR